MRSGDHKARNREVRRGPLRRRGINPHHPNQWKKVGERRQFPSHFSRSFLESLLKDLYMGSYMGEKSNSGKKVWSELSR